MGESTSGPRERASSSLKSAASNSGRPSSVYFASTIDAKDRKAWFKRVREEYLRKKKQQQEESNRDLLANGPGQGGEKNLKESQRISLASGTVSVPL